MIEPLLTREERETPGVQKIIDRFRERLERHLRHCGHQDLNSYQTAKIRGKIDEIEKFFTALEGFKVETK